MYPLVHRVAAKFPQLPQHVNAYVVELENCCVVVDSTIALSSARRLKAVAAEARKPIEAVLLTHGHPDHFSGLKEFEGLPIYASQGCLDFAKQEDAEKGPLGKEYHGDDFAEPRLFPNQIIPDGTVLTFDGYKFQFTDMGPGESPHDGMWVVKGDTGTHAFVGDIISNHYHCFFRDGFLREWNLSLDRLEKEFANGVQFYYGHGEAPRGLEQIRWQRGYNNAYLATLAMIEDRSDPASEEAQEKMVVAMKKYLPNDNAIFLLLYDLGGAMGHYWKEFGMLR